MKKNLLSIIAAACCISTAAFAQTNYALSCDGTAQYADAGSLAGNGVRTVECWFTPAINYNSGTLQEPATLVYRNTTGDGEAGEFGIFIGPSVWSGQEGRIVFGNNVGMNPSFIVSNSNSWQAGVRHHVAGVIDPVNGMLLYIDGVLQNNTAPAYTGASETRTEITAIGQWGDYTARHFDGKLDEVRMWNRALSQAEVQQKMCSNLSPANETGLRAYWKMDEGSGTVLMDATTNGYNATIYGAAYALEAGCTSGVAENPLVPEYSIRAYPNPMVSDVLKVSIEKAEAGVLSVYNMLGEKVMEQKTIAGSSANQLNTAGISAGAYILMYTSATGARWNTRIVKQ